MGSLRLISSGAESTVCGAVQVMFLRSITSVSALALNGILCKHLDCTHKSPQPACPPS